MKRNLPKSPGNKGFTLIELLIVVTIIAILATITIAVFNANNPQQKARDSRRTSDINAVADGLESSFRSGGAAAYPALSTTMLSTGNVPQDTGDSYTGGNYAYCATSTNVAASALTWSGSTCPTAPAGFSSLAVGNPAEGSSWTICTHLELAVNGQNWYCRSSAQQ